jgi:phosphoglycolate phosphatase-like HAD superfamily hydrolase
LPEYFQSSLRAYRQIWPGADPEQLAPLEAAFGQLRPVIETGWEMVLLLRALVLGIPEAELQQDWSAIAQQLLQTEACEAKTLASALDSSRDGWIKTDLASWLAHHRFYPGVIEQLYYWEKSPLQTVIVTTKESRFVRALLREQGIEWAADRIWGKEVRQPKHQTLRMLLHQHSLGAETLWFVEDRLKTLQSVQQQSDLATSQLFLAAWGYTTALDQEAARQDSRLRLITLQQFSHPFCVWLEEAP